MSYCVFIPGIQGSELYQGEDNKRWPVLRRAAMEKLRLEKNDELLESHKMNTFFSFDVYNIIDNFLSYKFPNNYYHFSYDWRFELDKHFEDLSDLLEKKKEIIIIAHSMGGLITKLFVHWCDEHNKNLDISQIITLGTPWQGAAESLYWLKYGDTFPRWWIGKIPAIIGLNTADVMVDICNTFPSVFQLLPHDHYISNIETILYDTNGNGVSNPYVSLLNATQFKMYQQFSQTIQQSLASEWPKGIEDKHIAIIGHKKSTFAGIISEQNSAGGIVNKKGIKWTSGDGTVPVKSGIPLFKCQKYFIKKNHLKLAQSTEVLQLINDILDDQHENSRALRHFSIEPSDQFSGITYRVACPVSVVIDSEQGLLTGEIDFIDNFDKAEEMTLDLDKTNMYRIEDSFFVFIDDEESDKDDKLNAQDFDLEITSYDYGLATVEIEKYSEGNVVQTKLFEGLEISPSTKAILHVPKEGINIEAISLTKKEKGKQNPVKGFTLNSQQIKSIDNPKTDWEIVNEPTGETQRTTVYGELSLNVKIKRVTNVAAEDILEHRYMLNGELFHTKESEFEIDATEGVNKLTVFTVTKNGLVDKAPKTLNFEIGLVKVVTNKSIILTDELVEVLFNPTYKNKDEMFKRTFYSLDPQVQREDFTHTTGILQEYGENNAKVYYYTRDKFENNGSVEEIILPSKEVHDHLFKATDYTVRDIMMELGLLNPFDWVVKINNRSIKSLDSKITEKTRKVELSKDDTKYIIVLKEDYELFWERGLTEIITSGIKELDFSFVIKRSSSGRKVQIDNLSDLKLRVYSKENMDLQINLPVHYNDKEEIYTSKLDVSRIPSKVTKGVIKVYYKEKPIRELKFTFE